ncbi:hypothetical protein EIP91_004173 [Steccherinum ochraceum]|uniref:Uncharacterized protein n=1 Tax=Steccherinum ochraceum TaxID=92696 RepID=A0A4R0RSS6_9APHY|nr:hypothetical protein EIP91_004173 [Steccherinum ochraceum]
MPHARSTLTLSYSRTVRRSSSQPVIRSQYASFTLPSYRPQAPSRRSRQAAQHALPPSYEELMKTVDYRYVEQPPRYRSSFALSDIWEEDEVEIEISSILPNSPEYEESIELERKRTRFTKKLVAFVLSLRYKWQRNGVHPVHNIGSTRDLDLLA